MRSRYTVSKPVFHALRPQIKNQPNRNPNSRGISRGLLLSNDIASCHTTKPIKRCNGCCGCRSFPLPDNVIRHEGVEGSPVGHVGTGGKESTDIACCNLGWETQHEKSGDETESVEDNQGSADAIGVADKGGEEHRDDGPVVGLCNLY